MRKSTAFVYLLVLSVLLSFSASAQSFRIPSHLTESDYHPHKIIFKVKKEHRNSCRTYGVDHVVLNEAFSKLNPLTVAKKFPRHEPPAAERNAQGYALVDLSVIYEMEYNGSMPLEKAINLILATGAVEYAEPLYNNYLTYFPNDPDTASQYYLSLIKAYDAWDISKGDSIFVVGVTDTGTDLDHPDLAAGIAYNWDDPINGADDDNDGYVDNFYGWDVGQNDNDPSVDVVHGSFVSGLAGAVTDNGTGIAGPGFNVRYLPVKISSNGVLNAAYDGIVYAADMGCAVINCSWGSFASSQLGQDIVDYATFNKNSLVVGAAGNSGAPGNANADSPFYPASYKNVLSVTGTNSTDTKWVNSSYGPFVDISAPGEAVYSTIFDNNYSFSSGTSFAAPIVAAAAALIKSTFAFYTPHQIAEQLRATADDIYAVPGNVAYDKKLGKGRLNMFRALTENPKSVRMEDYQITDNNDNAFVGTDTLDITVFLKNYLQPLSNLVVSLTCNNPGVNIINGSVNAGSINTLADYDNTGNPFRALIDPSIPLNTKVIFTVNFTDGAYTDWQIFELVVNVDYINVRINDVGTSITSKSRIGYNITQGQGIGFTYNDGSSLLYEGGLMIGVDTVKVSDQIFGSPTSVTSADYVSMLNVRKVIPTVISDFDLDSRYNDDGAGVNQLDIDVNQKTYAWSNSPDEKYIIIEYIISNQGGSDLNNLHAGIYADWDIGAVVDNRGEYDSGRKMGYAYNTGTPTFYTGVKQLTPGANNVYALDNDGAGSTIGVYNGFTKVEKYQTLSVARPASGQSGSGNDVSLTVSSGPHTIPAGDSIKVAFALLADESLSGLQNSADAAQVKYNSLNVPEIPVLLVTGISATYPNPFSDFMSIDFAVAETENVTIEVMDVLGKLQNTLLNQRVSPGKYTMELPMKSVAKGIYFVRMTAGDVSQVVRVVKM